jgi:aarF domain-containing kinase
MLPEQLEKVLQQVQANADYMPDWQLEVSPHRRFLARANPTTNSEFLEPN